MASVTDLFTRASNGAAPVPAELFANKANGASSLSLVSATGWPTATAVHFLLYKTDTNGARVAGTTTGWKGTLSGTTISNLTLKFGTDDLYLTGATVVEAAPTSAWADDFVAGMIVSHNQDGTMITSLPLTTPKVTTSINDSNGNKVIGLTATTSAVNQATVANSATGSDPVISATGSDTNIGVRLQSKGDTGDAGFSGNHTGWVKGLDTWTYASATTFTIAGKDVTARFTPGTKLKLTQTTAKYFYVASSAFSTDTTVTITGGTDYTLANAAITLPFYSYESNPQGFPHVFAYTPTWTGSSSNPTIGNGAITGEFSMTGKRVKAFYTILWGSTTSNGSGSQYYSIPVTAKSTNRGDTVTPLGDAVMLHAGVHQYNGKVFYHTTTTVMTRPLTTDGGTGIVTDVDTTFTAPFTPVSTDSTQIVFEYSA